MITPYSPATCRRFDESVIKRVILPPATDTVRLPLANAVKESMDRDGEQEEAHCEPLFPVVSGLLWGSVVNSAQTCRPNSLTPSKDADRVLEDAASPSRFRFFLWELIDLAQTQSNPAKNRFHFLYCLFLLRRREPLHSTRHDGASKSPPKVFRLGTTAWASRTPKPERS
jgi:hypothetical protein